MIEISAVSKSYNGGKTYSVDNLSLTIKSGEIFGLLGPNGAGKSTLLNMLSGILKPDRGTIKIEGIDIIRQPLEAKRKLAFMSDSPDHLLRLKGYEFLQFIADVYGVPQAERVERIDALAKQYAMDRELNNQLISYSHGMRQKMMVMGALLPNPDVWLLDEPMTGLDPKASWILKQSMREHANSGKTVLFSTHVLDVAEKVVDRVGIINKGKLIFVGTVDEMRTHFQQNGSLEEMFLELTSDTSPLSQSSAQSGDGQQESSASSSVSSNSDNMTDVSSSDVQNA